MPVLTVIELSSQDGQRYWPKGQVDFDGSTAVRSRVLERTVPMFDLLGQIFNNLGHFNSLGHYEKLRTLPADTRAPALTKSAATAH